MNYAFTFVVVTKNERALCLNFYRGSFRCFDNGSDELLKEGQLQQLRPIVMDEINQESLDVGAVLKE